MYTRQGKQLITFTYTHILQSSVLLFFFYKKLPARETTEKGLNPYQWLHFSRHLVFKCFEFNASFISTFITHALGYDRTLSSHFLIGLHEFDEKHNFDRICSCFFSFVMSLFRKRVRRRWKSILILPQDIDFNYHHSPTTFSSHFKLCAEVFLYGDKTILN